MIKTIWNWSGLVLAVLVLLLGLAVIIVATSIFDVNEVVATFISLSYGVLYGLNANNMFKIYRFEHK